jgi:predicted nucleic acid-binding protein
MAALLRDLRDPNVGLPEFSILDTTILLKLIQPTGAAVKDFMARLTQQALRGKAMILVPILVMEESYFKLIQWHYKSKGYTTDWHNDGYKAHPELLTAFVRQLDAFTQTIVNLPAEITGPDDLKIGAKVTSKRLHEMMLENIGRYRLLPKDAYIVAEAQRLGINQLVTLDSDYDRLDGFTVYRQL